MCGRFAQTTAEKEKLLKRFRIKKIDKPLVKRYNIAPGQQVAVVLNSSPDTLSFVKWGLIPFWAKDEKIAYKMINARAETITEKPAYRASIKKKRCLILTDGFYEWKKADDGKHPYRICMKDEEPFALAGIWDSWKKDDKEIQTCSIITTGPNRLMKKIHDRMPVILGKDQEKEWLSDIPIEQVKPMLKSFDADQMKAYEISKLVNSPANDSPEVIEPVS